jgi:hypothetical protein
MKRRAVFFVMFAAARWFAMATSPLPEPGYTYECRIYFINHSSYNIYMELDITSDPVVKGYIHAEKQLALEQYDTLVAWYSIHVDTPEESRYCDANLFWEKIRFYDMDSGVMLYELSIGADTFVHTDGLERLNAVFELNITDALLAGGGQ